MMENQSNQPHIKNTCMSPPTGYLCIIILFSRGRPSHTYFHRQLPYQHCYTPLYITKYYNQDHGDKHWYQNTGTQKQDVYPPWSWWYKYCFVFLMFTFHSIQLDHTRWPHRGAAGQHHCFLWTWRFKNFSFSLEKSPSTHTCLVWF